MGDKELDEFFAAVDADGDGVIDHDEWHAMVRLARRRAGIEVY